MSREPKYLLRAAGMAAREQTFSHPWNPASEITGVRLSRLAGLNRSGVSLARVAPGRESFAYHSHHREEEWLYILSGRGIAEIDGREYEVGAGDFMAFPAPSVAHHLRNPFAEELVYLMGGEHLDFEIADFPRLGRRMLRHGDTVETYDLAADRELAVIAPEPLAAKPAMTAGTGPTAEALPEAPAPDRPESADAQKKPAKPRRRRRAPPRS